MSQKTPAHMAQHDLGNWEMVTGTYFPISQKTPAQMGQHFLGNWEIGKWLQVHISHFPNFRTFWEIGNLGNWEMSTGTYFPISQILPAHGQAPFWEIVKLVKVCTSPFPKRHQPICPSTIWEIWQLVEVYISQSPNFPKNPSPDGPALFGKLGNWEPLTLNSCYLTP